ncbi:uncharacterized protein [Palaemon carinicauda]|uniref:uncharacterized protein n=1 Tax=Palaemon carinicauda TaxID=392227 RepID=UPI0035B6837C
MDQLCTKLYTSGYTGGIGIKDQLYSNIRDIFGKRKSSSSSAGSRRGSTKDNLSGARRESVKDYSDSRRSSLKNSDFGLRQELPNEVLQDNSLNEITIPPLPGPMLNQDLSALRRRSSAGVHSLLNKITEEVGRREDRILLVDPNESSENTHM